MKYLPFCIDTETTGNTLTDKVTQVCYTIFRSGDFRESLVNPMKPIPPEASEVTHITDKTVANAPIFSDVPFYTEMAELLKNPNAIFVAHNANFDLAILRNEGLEITCPVIDTLRVIRHLDVEGALPFARLQYLRYLWNLDDAVSGTAPAHDARGDVMILEALFSKIMDDMRPQFENDDAILEECIRLSQIEPMILSFSFGKYRGRKVADIATEDRGYLEWLLAQKKASTDLERESGWIATLEHFLK